MCKRMLVLLDTSDSAECVLKHVREMATARAIAEVVLFSVVESARPAMYAYLGDAGAKRAEASGQVTTATYLKWVQARLGLEASNL